MTGRFATGLAVFYESARIQMVVVRSGPMVILLGGVQPAVLLVIALPSGGSRPEATRILISVLATSLWASLVWMAGGIIRRDIVQGTMSRNVVSVWDPWVVLIGKCAGSVLFTSGAMLVSGLAAALLRGVRPHLVQPGWFLLGVLVTMASAVALGSLLSCVFVLSRHGVHIGNALLYPVFILGGLLIPDRMLPVALRWISRLIPLRWAKEYLVSAAAGSQDWRALLAACGLTLVYLLAGRALFRKVVNRARTLGTLEFS
ncbi:ABC transporter permease [Streptomyces sp. NPDC002276]